MWDMLETVSVKWQLSVWDQYAVDSECSMIGVMTMRVYVRYAADTKCTVMFYWSIILGKKYPWLDFFLFEALAGKFRTWTMADCLVVFLCPPVFYSCSAALWYISDVLLLFCCTMVQRIHPTPVLLHYGTLQASSCILSIMLNNIDP